MWFSMEKFKKVMQGTEKVALNKPVLRGPDLWIPPEGTQEYLKQTVLFKTNLLTPCKGNLK